MKEYKYYVIGGQYEQYYYGGSNSLRGAKIMASRHMEFWDNHHGWNKPGVYAANDCRKIITKGMITYPDGQEIMVRHQEALRLN